MGEKIVCKVIIIGAGPAGLAAALKLWEGGVRDIVMLEREASPGGILRQCIHDGFGLTRFGETLSGPEYAQKFIDQVAKLPIRLITNATVIDITPQKIVTVACREGLLTLQGEAIILTMGCRERTRGALSIPGERPAGVFTAGVAQSYINLKNTMIGTDAIILGSGDIGMIMARRLTLEGVKVQAVFEIQPYPSGLPRNIEQCLNDYDIPLYLSHTVTKIKGGSRLEAVEISEVDANLTPIAGTQREYKCDTLILSVGLIPENELSKLGEVVLDPRTKGAVVDEFFQTSTAGIFAAGNVLQVHDLVDFVSLEAENLAASVTRYLNEGLPSSPISIETDNKISHTIPQKISGQNDVTLAFRCRVPINNCTVTLLQEGKTLATKHYKKLIPAEMQHILLPASGITTNSAVRMVITLD